MHRTIFVTGSTKGIGKATARILIENGCDVIIHGRSQRECIKLVDEWKIRYPEVSIDYITGDLSDLLSVKEMAVQIHRRFPSLNILINNAGTFSNERQLTQQGLERTWVVNYLSRYLLVNELLPLLKANGPSRIIDVSGAYHSKGEIFFDDLSLEKSYSMSRANNQSKLANVLHTFKLARELDPNIITVNTLHPGAVNTGSVLRATGFSWLFKMFYRLMSPFFLTPEKGASTSIHLALSSNLSNQSGNYFKNGKISRASEACYDLSLQNELWKVSQQQIEENCS